MPPSGEHPEPLSNLERGRAQERVREHLGDGAYVKYTGYSYVLYTSNGIVEMNHIELEHSALVALNRFAKRMEGDPNE